MKTRLKKLINKHLIYFFKNGSTRMKLKYFIQVNQLYLADDIKQIIDDEQNQKSTQISVSSIIKWKYSRNEYQDKILKISFFRQGSSIIDKKLLELGPQLEALFKADLLDSNNFRDYVEYNLLVKESANEDYYISQFVHDKNVIDIHKIRLNKYYDWHFEKLPHLLISGNSGSGKSYQLYEIISESKKTTDNIYICDGKNDELTLYSKQIFKIKNIHSNEKSILKCVKEVEQEMNRRFEQRQENAKIIHFEPLFLIIDEYTSLKLTMEKREYLSLEQSIKNLILKARSANIHLVISLQRASAENMNLDIRDNCSLKLGLGNLSVENYKMIFNETINKDELKQKEVGQGYIYLDGIIKDFKAFNIIIE
ncbi:cell division protein FtsK [Streptococcus pyogenes]|uniref:cell division protein FtsK n=1 Tax=Streptococcus pyogenes TaxID=1314 RepID=UPI0010A13AEB|nr:cell division protein FtsK [Streptococcus pyogenes]VHM09673.1 Tn916 ORF21 FtsK/SpoIIIE family protein [Streptococcus pyogenes]VHM21296.1 Tn916 ORF21 FtsK/SpoIIIE family protein [Streptococcus pyogenes]HEP1358173.1 cell division protein FtsK [Streptococcus pyogenes]